MKESKKETIRFTCPISNVGNCEIQGTYDPSHLRIYQNQLIAAQNIQEGYSYQVVIKCYISPSYFLSKSITITQTPDCSQMIQEYQSERYVANVIIMDPDGDYQLLMQDYVKTLFLDKSSGQICYNSITSCILYEQNCIDLCPNFMRINGTNIEMQPNYPMKKETCLQCNQGKLQAKMIFKKVPEGKLCANTLKNKDDGINDKNNLQSKVIIYAFDKADESAIVYTVSENILDFFEETDPDCGITQIEVIKGDCQGNTNNDDYSFLSINKESNKFDGRQQQYKIYNKDIFSMQLKAKVKHAPGEGTEICLRVFNQFQWKEQQYSIEFTDQCRFNHQNSTSFNNIEIDYKETTEFYQIINKGPPWFATSRCSSSTTQCWLMENNQMQNANFTSNVVFIQKSKFDFTLNAIQNVKDGYEYQLKLKCQNQIIGYESQWFAFTQKPDCVGRFQQKADAGQVDFEVQLPGNSYGNFDTLTSDINSAFDLFFIDDHPAQKCRDQITSLSIHTDSTCTTNLVSSDIMVVDGQLRASRTQAEGYSNTLYLQITSPQQTICSSLPIVISLKPNCGSNVTVIDSEPYNLLSSVKLTDLFKGPQICINKFESCALHDKECLNPLESKLVKIEGLEIQATSQVPKGYYEEFCVVCYSIDQSVVKSMYLQGEEEQEECFSGATPIVTAPSNFQSIQTFHISESSLSPYFELPNFESPCIVGYQANSPERSIDSKPVFLQGMQRFYLNVTKHPELIGNYSFNLAALSFNTRLSLPVSLQVSCRPGYTPSFTTSLFNSVQQVFIKSGEVYFKFPKYISSFPECSNIKYEVGTSRSRYSIQKAQLKVKMDKNFVHIVPNYAQKIQKFEFYIFASDKSVEIISQMMTLIVKKDEKCSYDQDYFLENLKDCCELESNTKDISFGQDNFNDFRETQCKEFQDMKALFNMSMNISRDGRAIIQFNQELLEQEIYNISQSMRFEVIYKNDEKYEIESSLVEWQRQSLVVDLGISKPLYVSRKTNDVLKVMVTNKDHFISKETSYKLSEKNLIVMAEIPKQMFEGKSETDLKIIVDQTTKGISIFVIISIIVQLFLKQKQSKMVLMVITFQIIGFINIYKAQYPPKVEIAQSAWRDIVTFENINLMTIKPYIEKYEWYQTSIQKIDFILNLSSIIQAMAISLVIVLLFSLLYILPSEALKKKVKEIIKEYKEKMVFSGIILSQTTTFVQNSYKMSQKMEMSLIFQVYLLIPLCLVTLIWYDVTTLKQEEYRKMFEAGLYENIRLNDTFKDPRKFYIILLLSRLLLFCFLPRLLSYHQGLLTICLIFMQLLFCMTYISLTPHFRSIFFSQSLNEICLLILFTNNIVFSDFVLDYEFQVKWGNFYIGQNCVVVGVNFAMLVKDFVQEVINKKRAKQIKENSQREEQKEEHKEEEMVEIIVPPEIPQKIRKTKVKKDKKVKKVKKEPVVKLTTINEEEEKDDDNGEEVIRVRNKGKRINSKRSEKDSTPRPQEEVQSVSINKEKTLPEPISLSIPRFIRFPFLQEEPPIEYTILKKRLAHVQSFSNPLDSYSAEDFALHNSGKDLQRLKNFYNPRIIQQQITDIEQGKFCPCPLGFLTEYQSRMIFEFDEMKLKMEWEDRKYYGKMMREYRDKVGVKEFDKLKQEWRNR